MAQTWNIGTHEVGKVVEPSKDYAKAKLKVWIGKIMPLIKFGKAKQKTVAIKATCYINDKECKPTPAKSVKTANFIEVSKSGSGAYSKRGAKVRLELRNKSVDNIVVSDQ